MPRSREQLEYHAAKERQYRRTRKQERDEAIVQLGIAAKVLTKNGYTLGQIVDLIYSAMTSS